MRRKEPEPAMDQQSTHESFVTHPAAAERLEWLVAHASGEHRHGAVAGCPACADRDALWSAVMGGEL